MFDTAPFPFHLLSLAASRLSSLSSRDGLLSARLSRLRSAGGEAGGGSRGDHEPGGVATNFPGTVKLFCILFILCVCPTCDQFGSRGEHSFIANRHVVEVERPIGRNNKAGVSGRYGRRQRVRQGFSGV